MNTSKYTMTEQEQLAKLLSDKQWRKNSWNLYCIKDKAWTKIAYKPNKAQLHYQENKHIKNIILKARQLWFSTEIDIDALDEVLFSSYFTAGIIADNKDSADRIFRDKVKFAYENLPEWLRSEYTTTTDRKWEIVFENNWCSISVDTSFRGWTLQYLHISELGKIANKYPEKAREIQTGALNTLSPSSRCDIESTAEWNSWLFYDMCMRAMEQEEKATELTSMDFKFHFYAWWIDDTYTLESKDNIRRETQEYFDKIRQDSWVQRNHPNLCFTEWQMRWYQKKEEEQRDDMKREFPSYPKEAFDLAIKGAYYEKELSIAREQKRIGKVPYDPRLPVNTHWDIWGAGWWDENAIWFYQIYGKEVRIIDYYECTGMWMTEIAMSIVNPRYTNYWTHYLPHDIQVTEYSTWVARIQTAREVLNWEIDIVPKLSISDGINAVRDMFPNIYFDESKCYVWLSRIWGYRREYDEKNWIFRDKPKHDINSNWADALRYLWVTYQSLTVIRKAPQVSRVNMNRFR